MYIEKSAFLNAKPVYAVCDSMYLVFYCRNYLLTCSHNLVVMMLYNQGSKIVGMVRGHDASKLSLIICSRPVNVATSCRQLLGEGFWQMQQCSKVLEALLK